jgi:hypothetical protein
LDGAKVIPLRFAWLAVALACTAPLQAQARDLPPGEYRVVNGRVDRGTYTGWRLFHSACQTCHGVDAGGTDIAPNLVERVKTMTPRAFVTKVLTSYRLVPPDEEAGTPSATTSATTQREALIEDILRQQRGGRARVPMPAWQTDAAIEPHVLDIYAYLLARADGKLPPGQPKLIRSSKR